MKTVLITGATGLIGQEIVAECHSRNWKVHYLTTRREHLKNEEHYKGFYWNPAEGILDSESLKGVDTIINLAGASIAKRWTKTYKQTILNSRVAALNILLEALKTMDHSVEKLVSTSAIGIYEDSSTHYYEEADTQKSQGFLGKVVDAWESAADAFKEEGIQVAKLRVGLVLSQKGGAFPKLVGPVKAFIGSPMGSGRQWQSWIHVEDVARMFVYVAEHPLEGVFNAVAPNAVKQRDLIKGIAKQLERPVWLPSVPGAALKLLLGDMAALLLESQRVSSKKIEDLGFQFKYHHLKPALEDLLTS